MPSVYPSNRDWALKMQPLAIELYYRKIWPKCKVKCLDDEPDNILKNILDVSGADKLLEWNNGTISFLAQRFRRWDPEDYDDFTLRKTGPHGGVGEAHKVIDAIENGKLVSAFYAYGHVNKEENDFKRFRIIDYHKFIELWTKGELPPPAVIPNKNRINIFFSWPFSKIPSNCILYQDIKNPAQYKQTSLSELFSQDKSNW